MRSIQFTTARECYDRQSDAGRFNPGRVAKFVHNRFRYIAEIPSGGRDYVYMFCEGDIVYCLSINYGLQYVGLTALGCDRTKDNHQKDKFNPKRWRAPQIGDIFLQYDYQIGEALGRRGFDLAPINIAKILAGYIQV